MTTDRELLELAAKAAMVVYESRYIDPIGVQFAGLLMNIGIANRSAEFWNPLTDDGDALRLAVKLRLEFEWWKNGIAVSRDDLPPGTIQHVEDDPYAATRRAIVRAAAEIGKATK